MAQPPLPEARLKFLNDSAHLMQSDSASTSAYLITQRNALLFEAESDLSQKSTIQACHACGTLFIPGSTVTIEMKSKVVLYNCKACGRQTRHSIDGKPPRARRQVLAPNARVQSVKAKEHQETLEKPLQPTAFSSSLTPSAMSIKKSAHDRKKIRKQSGLQGLLAGKAMSKPKSGFGLDLMDFMKKT